MVYAPLVEMVGQFLHSTYIKIPFSFKTKNVFPQKSLNCKNGFAIKLLSKLTFFVSPLLPAVCVLRRHSQEERHKGEEDTSIY